MEPTLNTSPVQNPMPEAPTPVAQSMPQQAPVMETPVASAPMTAKKNSFGPLIGAVIIILILIAGALYFWSPLLMPTGTTTNTTSYDQSTNTDVIDAATQVSAATASVDALGNGSMEADLNTLSQ